MVFQIRILLELPGMAFLAKVFNPDFIILG